MFKRREERSRSYAEAVDSRLMTLCCSRRPRLEPLFLKLLAGFPLVAERDIIFVLDKYV